MTLPSRFWSELSTRHFAQLAASPAQAQAVAVLPVAATEQHGPHLPTGVDSFIVDGVVQAALPHLPTALPVVFLPTLQVGKSNEHERFAGTLTLSSSTILQQWTDIGAGVARAGFKKLLLLNAHGGHVGVMDLVARDLRSSQDLIVYATSWHNLPLGDAVKGLFPAHEHRFGVHAGDIETSVMLALKPHLVDMALAQHFRSTSEDRAARYPILGNGTSAKLGWQMQDYNPLGAAGNAAAATADKGRALLDAAGLLLARLLQELSDLPLSTLRDAPSGL